MAVQRISPTEAHDLLGQGYIYVDVRSVPEYEQGHPKGAVNVPIMHAGPMGMSPNPDFLTVMSKAFPKDTKIVLGCKSGQRSQRAAMMLEQAGFSQLREMRGGFMGDPSDKGWQPLGLPSETQTPGGSWAELQKK